jgi:hypothetical protein
MGILMAYSAEGGITLSLFRYRTIAVDEIGLTPIGDTTWLTIVVFILG